MKRNSKTKRTAANKKQKATGSNAAESVETGRRGALRLLRNGAIAASVLGVSGFALVRYIEGEMHEHDLSRIGNGIPTIVQIHDPQCPMCRALQKETRSALKNFGEGELDYVVADIRTAEGQAFATEHGVQHVTLLLFNKNGVLKNVLQGQRSSRELRTVFQNLL